MSPAGKAMRSLVWICVTLVFTAGCGVLVLEAQPGPPAPSPRVSPPPPEPAPRPVAKPAAPVPRPAAEAPETAVPALVGLSFEWAKETLRRCDLLVGRVDYRASAQPPGTVLAHWPDAGERVAAGSRVRLTIARAEEAAVVVPDVRIGPRIPAPPARVRVPDLVGMTREEAMSELAEGGLRHAGTSYTSQTDMEPHRVVSQAPAAGELAEPGSGVSIVVSSGPGRVTVPDVVNRSAAAAVAELRRSGLRASLTPAEAAGGPDRVISQTPQAGTVVVRGTIVELVTSRRPSPTGTIAVPLILGRSERDAEALVRAAGLAPGEVGFAPGAPGRVISQTPEAGTVVTRGTAVSYVLGRGGLVRPTKRVNVPNVVGRTRAQAQVELARAGLRPGKITTAPGRPGVVVSQDPAAGRIVQAGSAVDLVRGSAAPSVRVKVPDVLGLRYDRGQPEARLRAAGLTLGRVTFASGEPGVVLSQNPSAGALVAKGTAVDVVVGRRGPMRPPTRTRVPNVVGLRYDRGDAKRTIEAAGLALGRVTFAAGEPGVVLSQNPSQGALVARGTAVDITVGQERTPKTRVPNIVGLRYDRGDAKRTIMAAGLALGRVTFAAGEPGVVLSQNPSQGALVARGTAVDITVGRPAPKVAVPSVVGMQQGRAYAEVRKAGLAIGKVSYVEGERQGEVVRQSPSAGARVERGSRVDLVVARRGSKKDEAEKVTVPSVTGLTLGRAGAVLRKAGLEVGRVVRREVEGAKKNTVVTQSPRAGTVVARGSRVSLVIAQ